MMFSKMLWLRTKKNRHENSFRRKDVLLSKENLYWDDMHQRGYSDPEFFCNTVNPTVEDENTVWKVRGCQGESGQYLEPQCQALVMKETVLYGPEIKVRPLPPLPQATPTSSIYDYVDKEIWSDEQRNSNEKNHYEERLHIFKEIIISNVDVRQILPHLIFVEYPQQFRNIATNKSKRDAMICLLDEIEKSEELGRWKQFVEALERCGYEYISRCLKGRSVIDNSYQKKFLKIMSVAVRKQIVPTELTAYLWNVDVINDEDKQRIECQQTLQGEIAAADLLLEILPTKKDNWYKLFIDALRHAKMIDVANVLDLPELREGKTGPKIISTRNDLEFSPANSMQEVTERIQCNPLNDGMIAKRLEHRSSSTSLFLVETNPDSDTTALKSTPTDDVNEQNTKMNYENKDSSNMNIMEKELYSWSSWASSKSVPDIPFFVVALHSRQKEREMELSISEGDCLKVVEDYGNFYGVQSKGITWLIPKDSAKIFDKVPFPLPDECAESADDMYTHYPPLPERVPVKAFMITDTTDAATDCDDERYEEVKSPDLRDTVDEEVYTQGSLHEYLDLPPLGNAFKKIVDSRENNVRNAKCTRQLSSSDLLKDSSTLDGVIDADWKTLKEERDRLLEAERLAKEELEQLRAVVNIKNNLNELQCQKLKLAKDFASAGEKFKLHRESIKGVESGDFDHVEPESEYSSEGLYSAQHMLRHRMKTAWRDLSLKSEIHRARSISRTSWRSRASSFKDSAIYECTGLATVEEDT